MRRLEIAILEQFPFRSNFPLDEEEYCSKHQILDLDIFLEYIQAEVQSILKLVHEPRHQKLVLVLLQLFEQAIMINHSV